MHKQYTPARPAPSLVLLLRCVQLPNLLPSLVLLSPHTQVMDVSGGVTGAVAPNLGQLQVGGGGGPLRGRWEWEEKSIVLCRHAVLREDESFAQQLP